MSQLYFDNKYKSKGGIKQLKKMMDDLCTLEQIGKHFGVVGKDRVRQWIRDYFGVTYDPRPLRRRKKVDDILVLFEKIGTEKTIKKLGDSQSSYLEQALKEYHGGRKEEKN